MIITNNENALRVVCEKVSLDEVADLIDTLENELQHSAMMGNPGIGLAAPQIGINKDIAIVRLSPEHRINIINCQISAGFDPAIFRQEGCLSFPGRVEDTMRYQEIHVVNNLMPPYKFIATGLLAVVCQHEIDHLNQKLFIDHVIKPIPNQLFKKHKVGPNDPCACGSGKKFKKCCSK